MDDISSYSAVPSDGLKRQLFDAMSDQSTRPSLSVATAAQKATAPLESDDCATDNRQSLLEECLKKAREWEKNRRTNEAKEMEATRLRMLIENVIWLGNPSFTGICSIAAYEGELLRH